jgi:phosphoglycerate dehydrogenase-like enzyme
VSPAPSRPLVAVTFGPVTDLLREALGGVAELAGASSRVPDAERAEVLGAADALLIWNASRELRPGEGPTLPARFVQLVSAGADHLPFAELPPAATVASNVGAYAEPMAEHALAMVLALLKRLPQNHAKLAHGVWDQSLTRSLQGATCGIVGFGGIGRATGRRMRALGARVLAINTTGRTGEQVDFAGTLADLDEVLAQSDVVVLSVPLTRATVGLISRPQLEAMKPDAVLVNVARGAVVDEAALYAHLRDHPEFSAGIDTWWVEPFHQGEFRVDHPFFSLENVLGSPHNSALVPGMVEEAVRRAAANVARFLRGEPVTGVVRPEDYAGV